MTRLTTAERSAAETSDPEVSGRRDFLQCVTLSDTTLKRSGTVSVNVNATVAANHPFVFRVKVVGGVGRRSAELSSDKMEREPGLMGTFLAGTLRNGCFDPDLFNK